MGDSLVQFQVMKIASIIAIFLIPLSGGNFWPGVGLGRHPAMGGGPFGRHPALGGGPHRGHPSLGGRPDRRHHGHGHPSSGEEGEHSSLEEEGERPTLQEGMLITGGWKYSQYLKSVEVYNPYINKICKLPDLPYAVSEHTLCGGLACGGSGSPCGGQCMKFGPSGFVKATVSLKKYRRNHLCWKWPRGVLLLGGDHSGSRSTTELVSYDGSTSESKFDLSHPAKQSCGVDARDGTFIIIGGYEKDDEKRVTLYQYPSGTSRNLPNLNQGRRQHSCTHVYMAGTLALVVTGGRNREKTYLDSTEVFYGRRWITTAKLPDAMYGHAMVTVNNRVFSFGGRTGSRTTLNKVQVYSHWYNMWQQVVTLAEGTAELAVSVIPNIWRFC